jgi:hypothetical protein
MEIKYFWNNTFDLSREKAMEVNCWAWQGLIPPPPGNQICVCTIEKVQHSSHRVTEMNEVSSHSRCSESGQCCCQFTHWRSSTWRTWMCCCWWNSYPKTVNFQRTSSHIITQSEHYTSMKMNSRPDLIISSWLFSLSRYDQWHWTRLSLGTSSHQNSFCR